MSQELLKVEPNKCLNYLYVWFSVHIHSIVEYFYTHVYVCCHMRIMETTPTLCSEIITYLYADTVSMIIIIATISAYR